MIHKYPGKREHPLHPPRDYYSMAQEGPIARAELADGRQVWLVTRYAEARQVLEDTRFSSDATRPGFPVRRSPSALIRNDPPQHTHLRKFLANEFRGRAVADLEPEIAEIVRDLGGKMAQSEEVEFMSAFALPLPSTVICRLLAVPDGDHIALQEMGARTLSATASDAEVDAAVEELGDYMRGIVARELAQPSDSMVGRLARSSKEYGISGETLADLCRLLLVAGHVTTVNAIGIGLYSLLRQRQQWQLLSAEPSRVGRAVDELLRFLTVAQTLSRVATQDLEIAGVRIKEGDGVMVLLTVANRDERVFDRPNVLDISRPRGSHLAFGYGPHLCLGAALARLEMKEAFRYLSQEFPDVSLAADGDELNYRTNVLIYGVHELPLRLR
ncbi:cytochrome P450 [Nesterenkonia alkaliphila]|uniref:Cytochrome P450 n=1 Tax=Nesterenkonia alkaliphila TaxID=1463631 RepID=A0A7K1UGZ3_9MICC|nr:cytochrome P450 [Nesterenkonia alkaliphila]MVT25745.1 cytochrome P450 [Nesterenkonia alkaliphila]GFZ85511.1 cytochrome P450 [Nesterenkonia alkaliphila]